MDISHAYVTTLIRIVYVKPLWNTAV